MANYPGVAVRAIITDEQEQILFLRRQNTHYNNSQWCLPGGKVEFGQTVEEAVIREVAEETSLCCLGCRFLFYEDSLPNIENKDHYINFYFTCRTSGQVVLNDESAAFAWVRLEEMANYALVFGQREAVERALLAKDMSPLADFCPPT